MIACLTEVKIQIRRSQEMNGKSWGGSVLKPVYRLAFGASQAACLAVRIRIDQT
jgi:hypothetical protein